MMKRLMLLSTALMLSAGIASAAITADDLVTTYQAQGYTTIEVKTGPTQIKVEAVLGRTKVEAIYDAATGAVLKQESDRAKRREAGQGVELSTTTHDFLNGNGSGDDNGAGGNDGPGHDAGDDHGGHGNDDGAGHDAWDDHGGHGGDDGAGHDAGDDHGGRGNGSDD
jgi:hypothetical protein